MAITRAQQARQMLKEGGPMRKIKGQDHMLAYITPNEADKLVKLGGQETMTPEGILAYPEFDNYTEVGGGSRSEFEGGAYQGTGSSNDGVIQQYNTTKPPPKKPKTPPIRTRDRFVPPTIKAINYVGGMIKDSRLGRYLNTKARENYLNNLKEKNPELYQDTVDDLEKLGYAERNVEIYGPKGKRDGPMAPGRDIETFENLYEDQAKSILNTVTDKDDGSAGTLYDDYLDSLKPPTTDRDERPEEITDPCKGPNPPAYCFIGEKAETEEEDEGLNLRFRKDGGRINAMDGGMMSPEGGIMDLETGRQMYFLGKLVKKATRAVKKIAKSPIGKAALLYAGTAGLGSLASGAGMGSLFKLGTYAPSSFAANVPKIFSRAGLKNIAFGRPESVISPGGMDIFKQKATSGLFGKGGELSIGRAMIGASTIAGMLTPAQEEEAQRIADETGIDIAEIRANPDKYLARRFRADGGIMRLGYQEGSKEPVAKKTMPLLDMGGKEMDLREDGGFVPLGRMERADDVPARLSKNEFVFTADAVRNAGDGNVDKGAEVMYNMMKNLESGGDVSEESQGLEGARKMFQTSQRLEEVL